MFIIGCYVSKVIQNFPYIIFSLGESWLLSLYFNRLSFFSVTKWGAIPVPRLPNGINNASVSAKKVGLDGEQNMIQDYIFQRNRTHWLTLGTGQWWAFVDMFCEAIALHVVLRSCYSKHHVRPRCCQEKRDYHWGFTGILRWIGCPNCLFLLHRFVLLVYTLAPCPGPAVMGW